MEGIASSSVFTASDGTMRQATFVDLRQTDEWAWYLSSIGWKIERLATSQKRLGNFLYIRKIPLTPFAIAKLQRPRRTGQAVFARLEDVCRKYRVIRLYVEPVTSSLERQLLKRGFSQTKTSYLPRKTIWLDLAKTERQLLTAMKAKTRYNIGLAKRKGIIVDVVDGKRLTQTKLGSEFFELLKSNSRRLGIFALPRGWYEAQLVAFGEKCFVALAYLDNQLVAGDFFMTSKNACFYSHNGSTELGRKLMAPTLCAWEGIREAKRRKLKIFDFGGVDDGSRELKRWKGFSRFKEGFGGYKISFPPQYALWYLQSFSTFF